MNELKTPAHRAPTDDRFEEEARDLTRALPASRKVYIEGSRPDIQVPMREITLTDTPVGGFGKKEGEHNPPFYVYDTSGVYTDPNVQIDLTKGLPKLRQAWIEERGDTEQLAKLSSQYGNERANDIATASLRFGHIDKPRRALSGRNVTQMHYAKQG
ncbi:MAG: phosphomethylpyrimidine synthase ThiC, partial [Moraxella sp.]